MMKAVSLQYHDIVDNGDFQSSGRAGAGPAAYKLESIDFEHHMAAIADSLSSDQYPITNCELLHNDGINVPLFLTFDDGGVSAIKIAEILERFGWRGHFFVTANSIGDSTFLNKSQIRDLSTRGHVVGSHSYSHPLRMSALSWSRLIEEWETSFKILSDVLGRQAAVASIPGGYYSKEVVRAASRAGCKVLFTSEPIVKCKTVDSCLVVGRFTIKRGTSDQTVSRIVSSQRLPRLMQFLFWNSKKLAKRLGGEYYLRLREALVN